MWLDCQVHGNVGWPFSKPVPSERLGLKAGKLIYVCSNVMPMGWLASVAIFQNLHRRLLSIERPWGAGLPLTEEWFREQGPLNFRETKRFWQVYVDDSDQGEILVKDIAMAIMGTKSERQKHIQEAYEANGVTWNTDKTVNRALVLERLGALVDGEVGMVGAGRERRLRLNGLWAYILGQKRLGTKVLQKVLGLSTLWPIPTGCVLLLQ